MSSIKCDSLSDLARHGYRLRVECQACNHFAKLDPLKVMLHCHSRRRSLDLDKVACHLRCSGCGGRSVTCGPG